MLYYIDNDCTIKVTSRYKVYSNFLLVSILSRSKERKKKMSIVEKYMKYRKSVYFIGSLVVISAVFSIFAPENIQQYGRRLMTMDENLKHKDLFPLNSSDYWGLTFVTLGLLIAASGGIGGGGILVPLLILVFGFSPKHAIALSNFTIVGSSITNMVLNVPKRHPKANRPLVDWDLILVMEPLTMIGAVRIFY